MMYSNFSVLHIYCKNEPKQPQFPLFIPFFRFGGQTGYQVRLSQQELVDCSWGEGNNGCDGGEDYRAYKWIMKNGGITSEEQYGDYIGQVGRSVAMIRSTKRLEFAIDDYSRADNGAAL